MYKNVKDTGKSVSFVLKDIDIGGQIQYVMCTGPYFFQSLRSNYPLMDKHACLKGVKLTTDCGKNIFLNPVSNYDYRDI